MYFSCRSLFVLTMLFTIFMIKAYYDDKHALEQIQLHAEKCPVCSSFVEERIDLSSPEQLHNFIVDTMKHENRHGHFTDSKVKKMLNTSRDQIIRGALLGALNGSSIEMLHGGVAWALSSGIISGCGDLFGWKTRFF